MDFLFKKLIVWQRAMEFAKLAYGLVKQLPVEERYALADQLRRAAASVPSNIAEVMVVRAIRITRISLLLPAAVCTRRLHSLNLQRNLAM